MTYKKYKPNKDFPPTLTDLFPALGRLENGEWAVTVENCIYYLSLLEQFSQLLFKFKDHLDAFHVRAEKRYELWTKAIGRRNAVGKLMVPPVDVAYLLHTHLLLPQRYVEDSERLENDMMDYVLPLKELHIMRSYKGSPSPQSRSFWKYGCSAVDEPFTLELKHLEGQTELPHTCVSCSIRLTLSWEEYGQWRSSYDAEYKCWRCPRVCSTHDQALQELWNDIHIRGVAKCKEYSFLRGTMLDTRGILKAVFVPHVSSNPRKLAKQKKSISSRFKQFSFFPSPKKSGSEPAAGLPVGNSRSNKEQQQSWSSSSTLKVPDLGEICGSEGVSINGSPLGAHPPWQRSIMRDFYRQTKVSTSQNMDEVGEMLQMHLQKEGVDQDCRHLKGRFDILQKYYSHPSIFSVDLIYHAKLQSLMSARLLRAEWQVFDDLIRGIRGYEEHLCKKGASSSSSSIKQATSLPIQLAWRVHMLHPQNYRQLTSTYLGRLEAYEGDNTIVNHVPTPSTPPAFMLDFDYRYGSINLDDPEFVAASRKKGDGQPIGFDALPYIITPSLLSTVKKLSNEPAMHFQTQSPPAPLIKDIVMPESKLPASRTIWSTGRKGGWSSGSSTGFFVSSGYSGCEGYSGCGGGCGCGGGGCGGGGS